ncbi:ATP-dependent nuclease [Brevibacillus brevis]|uniref:AAA family ATPase n=1 Tax=Brevibacillus brevis TaxID=1393 RepID=A0A517IBF5_BREBE|nr:AAA family ATPase [Brevibacillus brevis]QDS36205.1 AAA family ATPase [Brevibacillus brevis]
MRAPYISRVKIKNYRNFKEVDVNLSDKQVIIGENNVGKTNFIRAIQLILDPQFSDEDRYLDETDFHDGLVSPMENGEEIEVIIEIKSFTHIKNILCQISGATISADSETLRITYRYYPIKDDEGKIVDYDYIIFKGENEAERFGPSDRRYLNLKVIKPIRDVDSEMKNFKKSPLNSLLEQYDIDKKDLELIAAKLNDQSDEVLSFDEIRDLETRINNRFTKLINVDASSNINLKTNEVNPNRILNTLKLVLGARSVSETSLGLTNILYISLVILSIEDNTVPSLLKKVRLEELRVNDTYEILEKCYSLMASGNYRLIDDLDEKLFEELYMFLESGDTSSKGVTILAIEEPEAHLHPSLQRIVYKDLFSRSSYSVLMTTHSTHITSVAPIESIVHLFKKNNETNVCSTANLGLTPDEYADLSRYIDAKRGEIYFGKGIILVEGIAEEYLIPEFSNKINFPLDYNGIIVCNINSTNFNPYIKFLNALNIPFVVVTDGDFYEVIDGERKFHKMYDKGSSNPYGILGLEIIRDTLIEIGIIISEELPIGLKNQMKFFRDKGYYMGVYTLEVEIMKSAKNQQAKDIICNCFDQLTSGGSKQKENFKNELNSGDYWACLRKIESSNNGIGKGRFAQRFTSLCTDQHIPIYIRKAIEYISSKVNERTNE